MLWIIFEQTLFLEKFRNFMLEVILKYCYFLNIIFYCEPDVGDNESLFIWDGPRCFGGASKDHR